MALDTPQLCDEVALIVAVTGRELISWTPGEDFSDAYSEVLLLASPAAGGAAAAELSTRGVMVRTATVTDDPMDSGPQPTFLLPGEAPQLAAYVGAVDQPDCVVFGSVGGAGTSVFAAAVAGALADPALGGDGQALLVDAEGAGQLDLLLGLEGKAGLRMGELSGCPTFSAARMRELPWAGDVGVLTGEGSPPEFVDPGCPLVRDCGRWVRGAPRFSASRAIVVIPVTVPGVVAARDVLEEMPGAVVVLRLLPRAELKWNDAVTLLGRVPEVTWEDDPFLTGEIDQGRFAPGGSASGTAGTAAASLVRKLW